MITSPRFRRCTTSLAVLLTLACSSALPADSLGEMLKESGWNRMLGTWIDKDSNGETIKLTYAWKFENTLLALDGKFGDTQSTALIGVKPNTDEIYHASADNKGGAGLGRWEGDHGDAILALKFVSADGTEGEMRIRHHFDDDDTIIVTIEGDDPTVLTLVRAK